MQVDSLKPGSIVARQDAAGYPDPSIRTTREVGVRRGYADFGTALDAARGVSASNLPAVAIVELGGRFHTYQLAEHLHLWNKFANAAADRHIPEHTPAHLPAPSWSRGIYFTDERLSAIVDAGQVVYGAYSKH